MRKTESGTSSRVSAQRSMDASAECARKRLKGRTDSSVDPATRFKKIRITKRIKQLMSLAEAVRQESDCKRRMVGCVITPIDDDDGKRNPFSTGWNSPTWADYPPCIICKRKDAEVGEQLEKCPAVHAEVVAAIYSLSELSIGNDKLLVTTDMVPCQNCMKVLILTGVKRIIVGIPEKYDNLSISLAGHAGIEIYFFEDGGRII